MENLSQNNQRGSSSIMMVLAISGIITLGLNIMTNKIVQDLNDPAIKIISTQIAARIAASNIQAQISHKENIDRIIASACKSKTPTRQDRIPGQKYQEQKPDLAACVKDKIRIDNITNKKGHEIFNSKKMGVSSTTGAFCKKSDPSCDLEININLTNSNKDKKNYSLSVSINGAKGKGGNIDFERLTREFEF